MSFQIIFTDGIESMGRPRETLLTNLQEITGLYSIKIKTFYGW